MSEEVKKLPSKIVEYDSDNECALCDDGSVWCHNYREKIWKQLHPPHEPPTQAGDLAEALAALRMLAEYACIDYGKNQSQCLKAFDRAWETLRKHGA